MRLVLAAALMAACGGTTDDTITIDSITPNHAPLTGGTRVVITGQGFLRDGASPNRVIIGDTEAPLAAAADDFSLEVATPPAKTAGDVPIIVFNRNGQAKAMGMFHYSSEPTITAISPGNIPFNSTSSVVTVTGTGFKDEDAGVTSVFLDGGRAFDLQIISDTQLTFVANPGLPLRKPVVEIVNARGRVSKSGFLYAPSPNPGLIMFTKGVRSSMALYYDPVHDVTVTFPQQGFDDGLTHVRATFVDANGDMWGTSGNRNLVTSAFGKIDFRTGKIEDPISITSRFAALATLGGKVYAYDRSSGRFGTVDPTTGALTNIASVQQNNCMSLTAHNNMLFLTSNNTLSTIDPVTGVRGTIVTLTPFNRFDEIRFLGNTLFLARSNGDLYSVNPATGASTLVKSFGVQVAAMEVFQP